MNSSKRNKGDKVAISIVVPVFNEAGNLFLLYERLLATLKPLVDAYEIIFVDDGSKDNSVGIIKGLAKKDKSVKYVQFSRNFGHQIAVTAGLDHCTGAMAVIIDSDLQDPPELIADMYRLHEDGFMVVYAKRKKREGESYFKKLTAKIFYRLLKRMTDVEIPVDTGDYRLIDRTIIELLKQMPEPNKFLRGQIAWMGFRQTSVEYDRSERHAGSTNYPFRKMLRLAWDGITAFSDAPLKLASTLGIIVSGVAFIIMLYALIANFFLRTTITGWTSLILSGMFIGGIQLLTIGIIGEYVARISQAVKNRPLYIVEETNAGPVAETRETDE
jgi:glycosyltransferase involved in cell wall biosynthesis